MSTNAVHYAWRAEVESRLSAWPSWSWIWQNERLRLEGLIESLRFGGLVPPSSELDRTQRSVERQIEVLRPDPDLEVRSRLRMRKETS